MNSPVAVSDTSCKDLEPSAIQFGSISSSKKGVTGDQINDYCCKGNHGEPRIDLFHRGKNDVAVYSSNISQGGACTKHNDPNISTGSSLETNANQLGSFSAIIRKKCQKTFADVKLH
jgi:hypothetical protein